MVHRSMIVHGMRLMRFTDQPFTHILDYIQQWCQTAQVGDDLIFEVPHPDRFNCTIPGSREQLGTRDGSWTGIYRPLSCWLSLAERLACRCFLPPPSDSDFLRLRLQKQAEGDLHSGHDPESKYGNAAAYWTLDKREWPDYVLDFQQAVRLMPQSSPLNVLELGCHRGDGYDLLRQSLPDCRLNYRGIDHAPSAIAHAKATYPQEGAHFECADLRDVETLDLDRYDLILALGVLHTTSLNGKDLLMRLVRHHLNPQAMIVLTFPNCRLRDTGLSYGAKMKNFSESDLSVLVREVAFYRRYLHGKGFRTRLFGQHYWFLSAWREAD